MKKEAKLLLEKATNSLVLSIEQFNRPQDRGRIESVLIFLDHAFEMLLKAALIQKNGKIRDKGARQTFGFDKCIRVALTNGTIKFLSEEQALTLQAINGLRDAAQHHLVDVSEGHLYVLAQSGVTLFRDIMRDVFKLKLIDFLPERVLPISTRTPTDLTVLFDTEIDEIKKLLAPGTRQRIAARAKLRGIAILEGAIGGDNHQPPKEYLDKVATQLSAGATWADIFPGVAAICLNKEGEGPSFSLRISKKDGIPITIIKEGEGQTVAIKRVNENDYYSLNLTSLSAHLGVGRNKLLEVIRHLKIQDEIEYFKIIRAGKVESKGYSEPALTFLRTEIPKLDIDEIWYNRK